MATNARMRRLVSDYEQVRKDFAGHQYITVTPMGEQPIEKYHVTYFVNGINLLPNGQIETLGRHEVEITLHAEYPRYKPICKILTPIYHPNFRDGQICIGDIWGAGESLSDIIINIGDMIQYKSWNSYSPLSADAAQWAMENKHLFPVGNIDLFISDYASAKADFEIDLFDDNGSIVSDDAAPAAEAPAVPAPAGVESSPFGGAAMMSNAFVPVSDSGNDFEITAEELAGIPFIPTAQRMQSVQHGAPVSGGSVNFKTIFMKGLLWALIGAILGFGLGELFSSQKACPSVARFMGYDDLAEYYEYSVKAQSEWDAAYKEYTSWCKRNHVDADDYENYIEWAMGDISASAEDHLEAYHSYSDKAEDALDYAYRNEFHSDRDRLENAAKRVMRGATGVWSAVIALMLGLFLGVGEGVFYGSGQKAVTYGAIGAGVSVVMGYISGYLAQWMYASAIDSSDSLFSQSFIRGIGWAIMGVGIGLAVGLIKPAMKRVIFCGLGGAIGAFIGGFLFNYVCKAIPDDTVARGVAIVIMGLLIGLGIGLLEQIAKQAWLKVIRGEFEGKEYLVFSGTTSIGNNAKNTIVLFKDKLVGPHHCDIVLEGNRYVLVDCGTPMGTVVNGMPVARHTLRHGDAIAIGNSVLVFNSK